MDTQNLKVNQSIDIDDLELMESRVAELERYLGIED
jgi:hypothetical protein